jgi:hypothetical protein
MFSHPAPSAVLVAANQRLHQLRENLQEDRPVGSVNELLSDPRVEPSLSQKIAQLPQHLGWDSTSASQVVRARQAQKLPQNVSFKTRLSQSPPKVAQIISETGQRKALSVDLSQSVKVYPDIALAMLRQEQAAAGRLWLLLRHLDVDGRGVLRIVNLRETLTKSKTRHRLCGWRQLRNLLRQGESVYWQRDKERVWLRSAGRVAAALGVEKLNGRPVAVPVKHLLGTIGEARAYLYASFHAGRQPVSSRTLRQKPIARDTLSALTGLTAECQRGYERRVGVRVSHNYVIGERANQSGKEERLWQHGGGAFEFVDFQGGQGKPGVDYMAWQLPNSYTVSLPHRPKGRQKRINRKLTDLFMQGMTGNDQQAIEKRYFGDGAAAAKAVGKHTTSVDEVFWLQHGKENGRSHMWYAVSSVTN